MKLTTLLHTALKLVFFAGCLPSLSFATSLETMQNDQGKSMHFVEASVDSAGVRWSFFDDQVTGELSTVIKTRFTYSNFVRGHSSLSREVGNADVDVTQGGVIATGTVLDQKFSYYLAGDFTNDRKIDDGVDTSFSTSPLSKNIPAKLASLEDAYITYRNCEWARNSNEPQFLNTFTTPLEIGLHFSEQ